MIITAKFASTCPTCSTPIAAGDQVEWQRGEKARHVRCAGGGTMVAPAPQAAPTERQLTVTREGRRSYITGDTLPVRGLLRDGGCHWDADRKAWWIGQHAEALALVERAKTAEAEAAPKKRTTHCVGCGCALDRFQLQRGFKFCSRDCAIDKKLGGQSGYVNGQWHQGSDD